MTGLHRPRKNGRCKCDHSQRNDHEALDEVTTKLKKRYLSWIIVSKQLLLKKIFCLTMLIAVKCWMIKARYMIWTMLTTFSRLCNLFWRDPWSSCHACPFGNDITNHLLKDLSTLIVLTFHPWTRVCLSRAKLHPLMAASKSHAVNFRLPGTAGGPVCESVSVS